MAIRKFRQLFSSAIRNADNNLSGTDGLPVSPAQPVLADGQIKLDIFSKPLFLNDCDKKMVYE